MRADLLAALKAAKTARVSMEAFSNVIDGVNDVHPTLIDELLRRELRVHKSAGQEAVSAVLDLRIEGVRDFDSLEQRIEELEDTLHHIKSIIYQQPKGLKRLGQIQALIERVMP